MPEFTGAVAAEPFVDGAVSFASGERRPEFSSVRSRRGSGDSYDNAAMESAIGIYKTELIRQRGPWRNRDQVEFDTLEYIDWINNRRLHGQIGHVPPAEFEEVFYASKLKEQVKG